MLSSTFKKDSFAGRLFKPAYGQGPEARTEMQELGWALARETQFSHIVQLRKILSIFGIKMFVLLLLLIYFQLV